jgi:photosystem II stability/assembly factor-like uncharacterized protein
MKKINLLMRIGLFILILMIGTGSALAIGETTGLALTDLSDVLVQTIAKTPSGETLYATLSGEAQGVYRSDDYGRSWQRISPGPDGIINNLVVHPVNKRLLYASTIAEATQTDSQLWQSQDGGQTWQKHDLDLPAKTADQRFIISVLTLDFNDPTILYLGTEGHGLYRVRPDHNRYEQIGDEALANLYVRDILVSPNKLVYAVTTEGLFVIDGKAFHKLENIPDTAVSLAIDPSDPQTLYAGTVAYGVYVSTDGGRTWDASNAGLGWQPGLILKIPAIVIDEENPRHLALTAAYGVGSHWLGVGVYESFNAGRHWVKIANNDAVIDQLLMAAGGIYIATPEGLDRYGDPVPAATLTSSFQSLTDPSGTQLLIMALTIALAAWTLLGRLPQHEQNIT